LGGGGGKGRGVLAGAFAYHLSPAAPGEEGKGGGGREKKEEGSEGVTSNLGVFFSSSDRRHRR